MFIFAFVYVYIINSTLLFIILITSLEIFTDHVILMIEQKQARKEVTKMTKKEELQQAERRMQKERRNSLISMYIHKKHEWYELTRWKTRLMRRFVVIKSLINYSFQKLLSIVLFKKFSQMSMSERQMWSDDKNQHSRHYKQQRKLK